MARVCSACGPVVRFCTAFRARASGRSRFPSAELPDGLRRRLHQRNHHRERSAKKGDYVVTFSAKNDHGTATKGIHHCRRRQTRADSADGLEQLVHLVPQDHRQEDASGGGSNGRTGMADVGYMYVNIDDCWMMQSPEGYEVRKERLHGQDVKAVVGKTRGPNGEFLTNANFPDMKAMTDYIHAKGLRAGIYTSPGPRTCQHYESSYQHERQDAEQFAAWGFDFLKYDWCTYGEVYRERMKAIRATICWKSSDPSREMGDILEPA